MDNPEKKDVRWWIQHFREFEISKMRTPVLVIHVWNRDTEYEQIVVPADVIEETEASFQYGSEPCLCWPHLMPTFIMYHLYVTL